MRKKRYIWLVLLVVAAVLLWWLWPRISKSIPPPRLPKEQAKALADAPPKDNTPAAPSNSAQPTSTASDQQKDARIAETRDILKGANQPVEFWGQVIDQDSRPLPEVKVKLSLRHTRELLPGAIEDVSDTLALVTDSQGMFRVSNRRGSLLSVEELKKAGYEAKNQSGRPFWYAPPMKSMRYTPDTTKPEIFRMWKLAGAEKLLNKGIGTRIPYDGTSVFFDLAQEREVTSGGDIKVTLKRTPLKLENSLQRYDWTATIEAVEGGLIVSTDEFMYRAPEAGYEPKLTISVSAEDPKWRAEKTVAFYLNSRGRYARVEADFMTYSEKPKTGFRVSAYINPSGSRNLEYDSMQDVADWAKPPTVKP